MRPSLLAKHIDHVALVTRTRWPSMLIICPWTCSCCSVRLQTENACSIISCYQFWDHAFISPVENEFLLFSKYQQSCTWGGGVFYSILMCCFVKHVLCVFSQKPVKCKCHVVYFKMLPLDTGDELSVLVVSSWREITQLPDYHSSIL